MIVAAVDRSDRAKRVVKEASRLSEALDEELHVVHVMSRSEFVSRQRDEYDESGQGITPDEVRALAAETARHSIPGGASYEAVGLVGKPEDEIVKYADEMDATYIVLSPKKQSPAGKMLFGSVAQSILLSADCPVVSIAE